MDGKDAVGAAERFRRIKLLILDVDGVLTDGRTWQDATGAWRRCFSIRDAMGIRALKKAGVRVAVITSAVSPDIREHMAFVGIEDFFEGREDKVATLVQLIERYGLSEPEIALMSDNPLDQNLERSVGCLVTVLSAPVGLKQASHYVASRAGGDGAVLEICSLILHTGNHSKAARGGRAAEA